MGGFLTGVVHFDFSIIFLVYLEPQITCKVFLMQRFKEVCHPLPCAIAATILWLYLHFPFDLTLGRTDLFENHCAYGFLGTGYAYSLERFCSIIPNHHCLSCLASTPQCETDLRTDLWKVFRWKLV